MAAFELELAQVSHAAADDRREAPALLIGRLYERHYRMIRALCQLLLRNPVDAEDAAQQTFLSAFGSLIDGTVPRQPAPWLATIARRECWARTAQRRRQPLALDETNAPRSSAGDPLEEAIRNADLDGLWKAINALPRQQRAAFLMREFSGLSYAEVAEALGASESAIESLLVRARRHLRDGLEPVLSAANAIAAPLMLLQHRVARLLGLQAAAGGATQAGAIPGATRVGAAVLGAALLGSVGAGVGVKVSRHRAGSHHASTMSIAEERPTASGSSERLTGSGAPGSPSSFAALPRRVPANRSRAGGKASTNRISPAAAGSAASGDGAAPADAAGRPDVAGAPTATPTDPSFDPSPTTGGSSPDASPGTTDEAPPPESAPADGAVGDTAPADTRASDTTPPDTAPVDATPSLHPPPPDPGVGDPQAP